MDLRKIIFEDNNFDGIWSCASLLHIKKEELRDVFSQFKHTSALGNIVFFRKMEMGQKEENGGFFSYRSLEEFETLLRNANFKTLTKYTEQKQTGKTACFLLTG